MSNPLFFVVRAKERCVDDEQLLLNLEWLMNGGWETVKGIIASRKDSRGDNL